MNHHTGDHDDCEQCQRTDFLVNVILGGLFVAIVVAIFGTMLWLGTR